MAPVSCVICDDAQHLWLANGDNKITITDVHGNVLDQPKIDADKIINIRFGPDHKLWVGDNGAATISVYTVGDDNQLTLDKSYGHKAKPGEFDPLAINNLRTLGVMPDGGFVMVQTYGHGSVVTRLRSGGEGRLAAGRSGRVLHQWHL